MVHRDGVTWKKLTIDGKYINKRVGVFVHQTMFISGVENEKLL